MITETIVSRLDEVNERIARAAERHGTARDVTVVAVTKGHPADVARAALEAGLHALGENRVGEMEDKVGEIGREAADWHYIGRLQRRKARQVVSLADLVQSVDSLRLAEALSRRAMEEERRLPVLVQVNASGEESKAGIPPEEGIDLIGAVCDLPGLRVEGLMTMAPFTDDTDFLRGTFGRMRTLFEEADRQIDPFRSTHLSMGMSNDYEIAVEEGSNMVRLGTVLFGERSYD